LGAILGFLKRLYEHKEKIILGALVIASIGVGYFEWTGRQDGPDTKGGEPEIPTVNDKAPVPQEYPVLGLGNPVPLETQWAMVDEDIFEKPEAEERGPGEDKAAEWPTIVIRSIFDATKSGNFIAIMEINGKREFKKEGEIFLESYEVRRIDGVRNCLTIVKRGLRSGGEEEREFCKDS
jgi:hypothetical protein